MNYEQALQARREALDKETSSDFDYAIQKKSRGQAELKTNSRNELCWSEWMNLAGDRTIYDEEPLLEEHEKQENDWFVSRFDYKDL